MEISIDKFGRVLIPKKLREQFHLDAGTFLYIEESHEGILLKPMAERPHLVDKGGISVYTGRAVDNLEQAIEKQRNTRNRFLSGDHEDPV